MFSNESFAWQIKASITNKTKQKQTITLISGVLSVLIQTHTELQFKRMEKHTWQMHYYFTQPLCLLLFF